MTGIEAIGVVNRSSASAELIAPPKQSVSPQSEAVDFASLLADGLGAVDAKIAHADALVEKFALDDSIPVHQVTIALEEARLSVELAMQVRARLVEGYKELMNLQL